MAETVDYGNVFKVTYKMQLVPSEASYNFIIDSQVPILMLVLQADIPIDLFCTIKLTPIVGKP